MKRPRLVTTTVAGVLASALMAQEVVASGPTVELETAVEPATRQRIVTFGLGAAAVPDYEGSQDYKAAPLPLLKIIDPSGWFVELVGNTLRVNLLPDRTWSLGPLARYRPKRGDVDNDKVDRMADVDAALELGGFLGVEANGWMLKVDAAQDVADGHDGLVASITGGRTWRMNPWVITVSAFTTYADGEYMSTYFGVSGADAARSGLEVYNADAGLKDVGATLVVTYRFSAHWGATGAARYSLLIGDAADSPLVEDEGSESQYLVGALVSYSF